MKKKILSTCMATGLLLATTTSANAALVELITNGGFETGDFTGWTTTDLDGSSGQWYVDDADLFTPESVNATVGPASGNFYAVTDQGGPGTHALWQAFLMPVGATTTIVSFDMFMNDQSGVPAVDPGGLDHNLIPNQHARVDILTSTATVFSTALVDVVTNLVAPGADAGPNPNPYTAYSIDVSGLLSAGTQYVLRFAETDNQLFFNQGVDNVSIVTETVDVPEPATWALLSLALAGMCASRKNKNC